MSIVVYLDALNTRFQLHNIVEASCNHICYNVFQMKIHFYILKNGLNFGWKNSTQYYDSMLFNFFT